MLFGAPARLCAAIGRQPVNAMAAELQIGGDRDAHLAGMEDGDILRGYMHLFLDAPRPSLRRRELNEKLITINEKRNQT